MNSNDEQHNAEPQRGKACPERGEWNAEGQVQYDLDDISEEEWLRFASVSGGLDFLNDPEEDIYTLEDGKPFSLH